MDQSVGAGVDIHLVLDNYGTHKHPEVKKWLTARPRYHVHFTLTSSSWLNQIERWFAEITRKRIRRGTFTQRPPPYQSDPGLHSAIQQESPTLPVGRQCQSHYKEGQQI
jgi:hypothetical protein